MMFPMPLIKPPGSVIPALRAAALRLLVLVLLAPVAGWAQAETSPDPAVRWAEEALRLFQSDAGPSSPVARGGHLISGVRPGAYGAASKSIPLTIQGRANPGDRVELNVYLVPDLMARLPGGTVYERMRAFDDDPRAYFGPTRVPGPRFDGDDLPELPMFVSQSTGRLIASGGEQGDPIIIERFDFTGLEVPEITVTDDGVVAIFGFESNTRFFVENSGHLMLVDGYASTVQQQNRLNDEGSLSLFGVGFRDYYADAVTVSKNADLRNVYVDPPLRYKDGATIEEWTAAPQPAGARVVQPGTNNTTNSWIFNNTIEGNTAEPQWGRTKPTGPNNVNPATGYHLSNPHSDAFVLSAARRGKEEPENILAQFCIANGVPNGDPRMFFQDVRDGTSNAQMASWNAMWFRQGAVDKAIDVFVVGFLGRHDGSWLGIRTSIFGNGKVGESTLFAHSWWDIGGGTCWSAARGFLHQPREWSDNRLIAPPYDRPELTNSGASRGWPAPYPEALGEMTLDTMNGLSRLPAYGISFGRAEVTVGPQGDYAVDLRAKVARGYRFCVVATSAETGQEVISDLGVLVGHLPD